MCPLTTKYVPSYFFKMCPHTIKYLSSYYARCVLILLNMCPHTRLAGNVDVRKHLKQRRDLRIARRNQAANAKQAKKKEKQAQKQPK